ncbi:MAG: hypothetical protein U1A77_10775 [Pirellulales bacterium]
MTINAGIWIDHHKAVVVRIVDQVEDLREVLAEGVEKSVAAGEGAGPPSYNRNDFVAEDRRERKDATQRQRFYDEVIQSLLDADSILIVGPGEAKSELRSRILDKKLRVNLEAMQTADKMTGRQVVEMVRKHYA